MKYAAEVAVIACTDLNAIQDVRNVATQTVEYIDALELTAAHVVADIKYEKSDG